MVYNRHMRLSIIVPVYNMAAGGKLSFCLNSLLNQTIDASSYEIIAVDDASTDDSYALMRTFEAEHPGHFFALRHEVNRHQGGAKNTGLKQARGEWISFIDADDWVAPTFYEELFAIAEKENAEVAGCDYSLVTTQTFDIGIIDKNGSPAQAGPRTLESLKARILNPGSLPVKIFQRALLAKAQASLQDHKLFPEDIFYEDNAIAAFLMATADRYAYLEKPLYYYYQHDTSTVHTVTRKRLEDRVVSSRLMLDLARKSGTLQECPEEICYVFTRLFYINTLFSALQVHPAPEGCYGFCRDLAAEMKRTFPQFRNNPYYQQEVAPEEKKLIDLQMRSHAGFYLYYRLLWWYRDHLRGKRS